MPKKLIHQICTEIAERLTERRILLLLGLKKRAVTDLLRKINKEGIFDSIIENREVSCEVLLECCSCAFAELGAEEPKRGWLPYIYDYAAAGLFPESRTIEKSTAFARGAEFYLAALHVFLQHEEQITGGEPKYKFNFLSPEEIEESDYKEEYLHFIDCFQNQYYYELMRIGGVTTNFDSLGHVCGVHNVAMHVARQMREAGVPIDLGLASAAAAAHDIGKYGCRAGEMNRIAYLHYYYTDQWLKKNDMPNVAHIASNHSTWDLELENLPVESLTLIFADFRVKRKGFSEDGKEIINIYSLEEAFSVILNKLDNVDAAKEMRYRHVYAKLADFENYMKSLGVSVDLDGQGLSPAAEKDTALLSLPETVERLKYMAISHNIQLMNKLSGESSFGSVLEAARSEKNWKNSRAYINLFEEYFTYMTQKQKLMTLKFLYELLMHREGDIRRQAAGLMGNIIVNFDEEYRKELPAGAERSSGEMTGLLLWEKYLDQIIHPDHKVTEQHRRWIGYALKRLVGSVLARCKAEQRGDYVERLIDYYRSFDVPDNTAFTLMDTAIIFPLELMGHKEMEPLISFAGEMLRRPSLELRAASLRFLDYLTRKMKPEPEWSEKIARMVRGAEKEETIGFRFLTARICKNWALPGAEKRMNEYEEEVAQNMEIVSDIFLDNLKIGTPWVIKAINIELLLDYINGEQKSHILHIATHFSNLLKVSERIIVRHRAGDALLLIAPLMSRDQRNEVAIELTKGLETGEYEFSKYIPDYLGEFVLYLHPVELDEFVNDLSRLLISTNERVVCVALDTFGVILRHYSVYRERFDETDEAFYERKKKIVGRLLAGLANYTPAVNQEAFLVIGQHLFGDEEFDLREKTELFAVLSKKLAVLVPEQEKDKGDLAFFNSAASLNHIYRYIHEAVFAYGGFDMEENNKIAFFPGTFDPFSLGHKEIAREIRDLGFTVYLALDEFSWSKKTQPRMIRRQIMMMSIASEENIYMFPDDIPVNIANPADLKRLRELFPGRELYLVVGSDVVQNASSYKQPKAPYSVHSLNHVIFQRESSAKDFGRSGGEELITGKVIKLKLPVQMEDISSTRIRENVDYNRDISNLIDPVAQNYIYENSLYLREPQYKPILDAKTIHLAVEEMTPALCDELLSCFPADFSQIEEVRHELTRHKDQAAVLRDGSREDVPVGVALFRQIRTMELYAEFKDTAVVNYIRENTSGQMLLITGIFLFGETDIAGLGQLLLTEVFTAGLAADYTYCIYSGSVSTPSAKLQALLRRQGFVRLEGSSEARPVFTVDMKSPVTVFKNIDTAIKEPFNHNPRVLSVIDEAHRRLQDAMTQLYPGNLVLSLNGSVMHHKLIKLITTANGVPDEPLPVRRLGPAMCVPFGKILRGVAVPNTVTKALHTEKTFEPSMETFKITEYPNYSPLQNQIRTIKSFGRDVILVDDLMHKGYRIRELNPIFEQENVHIDRIIVGVLSGRGKDLMDIQKRRVESVYFLPNMRVWFVESTMYPFIGGDTLKRPERMRAGLLNVVNMILPYAMPTFIGDADRSAVYNLSLTALENARDILKALEEQYQEDFERKLTLNRLSEAVISPSCPDRGICMEYDYHLAASTYVENDIEALGRLERFDRMQRMWGQNK